MRRKLTTLRAKQGHSQNGASRTLIDWITYRERANTRFDHTHHPYWDPAYSGLSNASRPRDCAITPHPFGPTG